MNWPTYEIEAVWGRDDQTPTEIGERTLEMLRRLEPVSPIMSNWTLGDSPKRKAVGLAEAEPRMTALVERSVQGRRSTGLDDPAWGYGVLAWGAPKVSSVVTPQTVTVSAHCADAGDNHLRFQFGRPYREPPDFDVITYDMFRGAMEVVASVWPCPWLSAYVYCPDGPGKVNVRPPWAPAGRPDLDMPMRDSFALSWIAYLSPALSQGLTPSAAYKTERTPGGGAFLTSVEGLFDPTSLEHLRRAAALQATLVKQIGIAAPPNPRPVEHPIRVGPY